MTEPIGSGDTFDGLAEIRRVSEESDRLLGMLRRIANHPASPANLRRDAINGLRMSQEMGIAELPGVLDTILELAFDKNEPQARQMLSNFGVSADDLDRGLVDVIRPRIVEMLKSQGYWPEGAE